MSASVTQQGNPQYSLQDFSLPSVPGFISLTHRQIPKGIINPVILPHGPTLLVFDIDNTLVGRVADSMEKYATLLLHRLGIAQETSTHVGEFYDLDKPTKIDKLFLSLVVNHSLTGHVDPWDIAMQYSALSLDAETLCNNLNQQLKWASKVLREETPPSGATSEDCQSFKEAVSRHNLLQSNIISTTIIQPNNQDLPYHLLTHMKFMPRKEAMSNDLFKVYEFILRAIEVAYADRNRNSPIIPIDAFNKVIPNLAQNQVYVAVATNRTIADAKKVIKNLGLNIPDNWICGVCEDLNLARKPHPSMLEHLNNLFANTEISGLENILMIGDAPTDPATALWVNLLGVLGIGVHPRRSSETFNYAKKNGFVVSSKVVELFPLMALSHLTQGAAAVFTSTHRFIEAVLHAYGLEHLALAWKTAKV